MWVDNEVVIISYFTLLIIVQIKTVIETVTQSFI